MKFIAKIVFKIYRRIYGYPCKSEVRLAARYVANLPYSLTYSIAILYICESSIEDVSEWVGLKPEEIKKILNELVEEYKWK